MSAMVHAVIKKVKYIESYSVHRKVYKG